MIDTHLTQEQVMRSVSEHGMNMRFTYANLVLLMACIQVTKSVLLNEDTDIVLVTLKEMNRLGTLLKQIEAAEGAFASALDIELARIKDEPIEGDGECPSDVRPTSS